MKPSLLRALAAAAIASLGLGCTSGNSGAIGETCLSALDCASPYECLPIYADGGCSKPLPDGAAVLTCQQTCSSECSMLQGNYTCSMGACNVPAVSGICRPTPP